MLYITMMIVFVVPCLIIQTYLVATKKISDPHRIFDYAKDGHVLGKICVVLYSLAILCLIALVVSQLTNWR